MKRIAAKSMDKEHTLNEIRRTAQENGGTPRSHRIWTTNFNVALAAAETSYPASVRALATRSRRAESASTTITLLGPATIGDCLFEVTQQVNGAEIRGQTLAFDSLPIPAADIDIVVRGVNPDDSILIMFTRH